MTDRDRLIELLTEAEDMCGITLDCDECKYSQSTNCNNELKADHLLANGVIVQKQGEWQDNHNGTYTCSICGGRASKMSYCGKCGAKLKELG